MRRIILAGLFMGLVETNAYSGGMMSTGSAVETDKSIVPQSAFFGGLGGGWISGSFGNQNLYGKGTFYSPSSIGPSSFSAQVGSAAGSTGLDLDSKSALAPIIQAGYFRQPVDVLATLIK